MREKMSYDFLIETKAKIDSWWYRYKLYSACKKAKEREFT